MEKSSLGATIYLAAEGYDAELAAELGRDARRLAEGARLFEAPGPPRQAAWATNVWIDPVRVTFASAGDASRALAAMGKSWALAPLGLFRRAALIAERVPSLSSKPIAFPSPPLPALGSWTLLDANTVLAAAKCTSPFPNGEARFVEDHHGPPSRAYLKLWEALTLAGRIPGAGTRCIDLGASPGGWTWALDRLGARVLSVDKASLDPSLASRTRVRFLRESAFALDPAAAGKVEWVVSDVICYPKRAAALALRWLAAHPAASFIVTIKLQGATTADAEDRGALAELRAVPGSRLLHLHHNKHELTWMRIAPPVPSQGT